MRIAGVCWTVEARTAVSGVQPLRRGVSSQEPGGRWRLIGGCLASATLSPRVPKGQAAGCVACSDSSRHSSRRWIAAIELFGDLSISSAAPPGVSPMEMPESAGGQCANRSDRAHATWASACRQLPRPGAWQQASPPRMPRESTASDAQSQWQ
ncbi:hypothetical protein VTN96DRAFT_5995 [Rasamsonia emersonii]